MNEPSVCPAKFAETAAKLRANTTRTNEITFVDRDVVCEAIADLQYAATAFHELTAQLAALRTAVQERDERWEAMGEYFAKSSVENDSPLYVLGYGEAIADAQYFYNQLSPPTPSRKGTCISETKCEGCGGSGVAEYSMDPPAMLPCPLCQYEDCFVCGFMMRVGEPKCLKCGRESLAATPEEGDE